MVSKPTPSLQPKHPAGEPAAPVVRPNAFRARDWETLFVVLTFVGALVATVWMVVISATDPIPDNRFRILPAASIMVIVELWLIVYLPVYGRLAYWGAIIALGTYLFFAVPFIFLNLLPASLMVVGVAFVIISLICGLLLFRQRARFLPPEPPARAKPRRRH